jgi:hypothetical protein
MREPSHLFLEIPVLRFAAQSRFPDLFRDSARRSFHELGYLLVEDAAGGPSDVRLSVSRLDSDCLDTVSRRTT